MNKTLIIDTPNGIKRYQMLSQISAMKLEGLGMRHSSGKSMMAHCKQVYKLKGNRESIMLQMRAMLPEA